VPVVVFVFIAAVLALGLGRNPRLVPSPLVDKPVPEFRLPPVQDRTLGLSNDDLRGQVSIVNVFASWCVACRAEHPLLMALAREGSVPIHGLNYKDAPKDAAAWLDALGDPYSRTGADRGQADRSDHLCDPGGKDSPPGAATAWPGFFRTCSA
jgi:cytochrome c biogenesis protein CcmG/thiol:disulfide interchange protein DsbE